VHANLLAASSPSDLRGEVINIGTGQRISLLDVVEQMGRELKVPVNPGFGPARAGDVRDSVADISRAGELLGYEPIVDFREGISRTLTTTTISPQNPSSRAATPPRSIAGCVVSSIPRPPGEA